MTTGAEVSSSVSIKSSASSPKERPAYRPIEDVRAVVSKSDRLSWSGVVFIVAGNFRARAIDRRAREGAAGIGLMGTEGRGGRGSGGPERQAAKASVGACDGCSS